MSTETLEEMCKQVEPSKEHLWLHKFVGKWHMEAECNMGPDKPPMKNEVDETVKSLGGLWIVGDGVGSLPDGKPAITQITLGYDPLKKKFVGTFVGSMMTNLWVYEGELDSGGTTLTLNAEGPSFTDPQKSAKYQDIFEVVSDDHRILKSQVQTETGEWFHFMTAHYRRQK